MTVDAKEIAVRWGYLTPAEVDAIQLAASSLPKNATAVNLGAGAGTSGLAIVQARPDVRLVTIDISAGGPHGGLENERNVFGEAGLSTHDQWEQHLLDSGEAAGMWTEGDPVHLLVIDANHEYEKVLNDLKSWWAHLAAGGYVLFHDYDTSGTAVWPDVAKAVTAGVEMGLIEVVSLNDTMLTAVKAAVPAPAPIPAKKPPVRRKRRAAPKGSGK